MALATLPNMYLTWEQSTEPLVSFLRYQIYRRLQGETAWTKIKRLTDRTITYYNDFTVASDETYEYAVTQVKDFAGEEVESVFTSPVSAILHFTSVFIHSRLAPEHYVALDSVKLRVSLKQQKRFMQVWDRPTPTAHIGPQRGHEIEVESFGQWSGFEDEVWAAVEDLIEQQALAGASLVVRHQFGVRYFCQLNDPDRSHVTVDARTPLVLTEVFVLEEVT